MRRLLRRARSLTLPEWLLLARVTPVVVVSRLTLWAAGMQGARRAAKVTSRLVGVCDGHRAPWAVSVVSQVVPAATCLTQAVALQALLERAGRPCRVEIGVATEASFEAHAWVVCGNDIVLGGASVPRFQRVATLD